MVNKLFYNTSGECVVDFNIWNTAHNLAFTVLTQQNIRSTHIKKTAFGVKYIGEQFASDFAVDPFSHALSATTCYSINNFILGARFLGDKQSLLRSLDPLLIYETRGAAFLLSTENLFSILHGAVLTEPFRNIRSGIFCDVSLAKKATEIAFGLSMKPYRNCDLLVKVDAKGAMLATYRLYLNKSTTLWTSLETKMDSVFDSSVLRVSMEDRAQPPAEDGHMGVEWHSG